MTQMKEAVNVSVKHAADLNTNYMAVVQKGNVGSKYIYAEQLRNNQTENHILRGYAGNVTSPVLSLYNNAGGHSQTWEYSGRSNRWFVGTKPRTDTQTLWDKQVARVNIKENGGAHYSNTDFPRLAYLDRAGAEKDHCANPNDMERSEAAVSPSYSKFLIATIETDGTGHFIIYNMDKINNLLDEVEETKDYVDLRKVSCLESFTVKNFAGDGAVLNSVQGYDLDDAGNIYISSQLAPDFKNGKYTAHHKQIVKIPTYARENVSQWETVNLSANGKLDISGEHTELEGIQILNENHCYLTVAYHANVGGKNKTVSNKIFEVSWT